MSQNNSSILHAGLDVAKLSLELHLAGRPHSLANDPRGHAKLLRLLRAHPTAHVICEATGGYEQPVVRALQAAGIPVSIIEPGRVRNHARAKGLRAKTDRIDAALLSHFGATHSPPPTPADSARQQQLSAWTQRRRQLLDLLTMERNRAEHYLDRFCLRQSRQLQKTLDRQIQACEQAITALIAGDADLGRKAGRLREIPGVGQVVAATVLAEMPELGRLNPETAAALAGVAPYNADSGPVTGPRHIAGGRKPLRCALYMAALSAVRHDPVLKKFYQRLRDGGKKPLVALTACMRKLIILMNRLLKDETFKMQNSKNRKFSLAL